MNQKLKHILIFYILSLLLFVSFSSGTRVLAEENAESTFSAGITATRILYETEELLVYSSKPVYYTPLKRDGLTQVKPDTLISATPYTDGLYLIDISTLTAGKDAFLGLCTTVVPGDDGFIDTRQLYIKPCSKRVDFKMNWAAEGDAANGIGVIESVIVKNNDSTEFTYLANPNPAAVNEKNISELDIQWRKGSNGQWSSISTLTEPKWESMKKSAAIIYLRIAPKNQSPGSSVDDGARCSREGKIKIAITRATTLKLDVLKWTINIKNNIQYRLLGSSKWVTILPYSVAGPELIPLRTSLTPFNPYKESTSLKMTDMTLDELFASVGYTPTPGVADEIVLEFRLAPTIVRPASQTNTIIIPTLLDAPSLKLIKGDNQIVLGEITKGANDNAFRIVYEYTLVKGADLVAGQVDFRTTKWSTVRTGTVLRNPIRSTYSRNDGVRRANYKMSDPDAVILVRRRGIAESLTNEPIWASHYIALKVTEAVSE